jgi:hypothetical protein
MSREELEAFWTSKQPQQVCDCARSCTAVAVRFDCRLLSTQGLLSVSHMGMCRSACAEVLGCVS